MSKKSSIITFGSVVYFNLSDYSDLFVASDGFMIKDVRLKRINFKKDITDTDFSFSQL